MSEQGHHSLPIDRVSPDVIEALRHGNVLLQAPPGTGKSTGLPLQLLKHSGFTHKIVMLEPRRIAARSVAQRLASQLNEPVGERIGLRMRGETRVSPKTQLEVVTEGVLTRLLQSDPMLSDVSLLIFDEFHERSLHADIGLAFSLEVQHSVRPDLRLLLMSATLDTEALVAQLPDTQLVTCDAEQFPVSIQWLGEHREPMLLRVSKAIQQALQQEQGDILCFLPGVWEIDRCAQQLKAAIDGQAVQLHKLHSGVSKTAQQAALAPSSGSVRRVILSTSIAETSVTIDGIGVVVDAGLERRSKVDVRGIERLETVPASQASATQRTGRAGRTQAGVCYRLWGQEGHSRRAQSWQPEILRAELSPLLLEALLWGASDVQALPWLTPPPQSAVHRAEQLLRSLGILQGNTSALSEYGKQLSVLPVHPRFGHLLLWACEYGLAELACNLVAVLEEHQRLPSKDLNEVLSLNQQRSRSGALHSLRAQQLFRLLPPSKAKPASANEHPFSSSGVALLLAIAFPDWIAQRRSGRASRFALACGTGAALSEDEPLAAAPWLAIAELGGAGREASVYAAAQLDIDELECCVPELFSHKKRVEWDEQLQRIVAETEWRIGDIVVSSKPMRDISAEVRSLAMLDAVRKMGLDCLPWDDALLQWRMRVMSMYRLLQDEASGVSKVAASKHIDAASWPCFSDECLLATLDEWLLPYLDGVNSLKALSQMDLHSVLSARLDYQQSAFLDAMLPQHYTVPSGSKVKLRYQSEGNPVLSVKLQEMFGCTENPSVAHGSVLLTVELLSPARRPVQITEDLVNFWSSSYASVKKDMAGRYPKHPWPDDPANAVATAYAKPRKPR